MSSGARATGLDRVTLDFDNYPRREIEEANPAYGNSSMAERQSIVRGGSDNYMKPPSNNIQKVTIILTVGVVVLVLIAIAVASATLDKVKKIDCTSNFVTATVVYEQLGLPGFETLSWNDVVARAYGKSVNFWTWTDGPDGSLTNWLSGFLAPALLSRYGITLNVHAITSTATAVNQVIKEVKMNFGMNNGSVDMIWINLQNFYNLKSGGYAYGPFTSKLPSSANFDFSNPAIAYDGGSFYGGYEMPYNGAQVVFIYSNNKFDANAAATTINTIPNIGKWILGEGCKRFTYANPALDHTGSAFIRHVLYALGGPYTDFIKGGLAVNEAMYITRVPAVFSFLRSLETCLYSNSSFSGNTHNYPSSNDIVDKLFGKKKVDLTLSYTPTHVFDQEDGKLWPIGLGQGYVLDTGTIGNTNYIAIPANARNKLAALVATNYIASPPSMFSRAQPNVLGYQQVYNPSATLFTEGGWQVAFDSIEVSPSTPTTSDLNSHKLGELSAAYISRFESDWALCVQNFGAGNTPTYCGS